MLINHLYVVESTNATPGQVEAQIRLDPLHPVFKGHFPGSPVLPGVCMMQIVKELLEIAVGSPLLLREVSYAKFLSMVNPLETDQMEVHIEYSRQENHYEVKASLQAGGRTCLKYLALFHHAGV